MLKRAIPLSDITPTAAGAMTTIRCPLGRRYHYIVIEYRESGSFAATADLAAALTGVRIKVNGKEQWGTLSADDVNTLNSFEGLAPVNGYLILQLASPRARTIEGTELTAWGTLGIQSLDVEIDVDAAATAPTIKAWAVIDDAEVPLAGIRKIFKQNITSAGAAVVDWTTLPKRDVYKRLTFRSSVVTAVKVKVDSKDFFDLTRAQAEILYGFTPISMAQVANNMHVAFDSDDRADSALAMAKPAGNGQFRQVDEFLVAVTCSGSGTIPVLIERFGPAE